MAYVKNNLYSILAFGRKGWWENYENRNKQNRQQRIGNREIDGQK